MKYNKPLFVLLIVIILALPNSILATIELGNLSHEIQLSYTSLQPLTGWVNISLNNEPTSTVVSAFDKNLTLIEFLEADNIVCSIVGPDQCSCIPTDCNPTYSIIEPETDKKTYNLNIATHKVFGIKLTDKITATTNFKFKLATNSKQSCINPLLIDLLDDGNIEYKVTEIGDQECYIQNPTGCFNSSDIEGQVTIGTSKLCGKIILPPAGGFKIGAMVTGTGDETFTMSLNGIDCPQPISTDSGGEISCKITLDEPLTDSTEADVCIFSEQNTNYIINFEDENPCGYVLNEQGDEAEDKHDYELFAVPLRYLPPSEFEFNQNEFDEEVINLNEDIQNYIDDRYNGNCNPECIIPIRIFSGYNQEINISDLLLDFNVRGQNSIGSNTTKFSDLESTDALMTSEFLKINLQPAIFLTPFSPGEKDLKLKIGDKTINENITTIDVPKIIDIFPTQAALLVTTNFEVILNQALANNSNLTFTWDFGDGTQTQTTNKNNLQHTYSINGSYKLTVNVTNNAGDTSKSVNVNVIATIDAINNTIEKYKSRLKDIDNKIIILPDWIQSEIQRTQEIETWNSDVDRLERNFKEGFQDEFIKIMTDLNNLIIPRKFDSSYTINPTTFLQNRDRLDLITINDAYSLGSIDLEKEEEYYDAINRWLIENIDISFESKTYSFYYEDSSEQVVLSHAKIKLTPKKDIEEFYMIIPGDVDNIKFKPGVDYVEKELINGYGIRFSELRQGETETVEFAYPETISFLNPPVYVSPEFRNLELGVDTGVCNNDNVCDSGETYKNCRVDCKPWGLTSLFLGILLFIALVVYIVLQEWYKRNYESKLFKNKNQLFNLITFMQNGVTQKLSKSQIFSKLKSAGWNNEQLNYGWKKVHGKRTGMWEIPIFLPFEKLKVKKEIAKRATNFPPPRTGYGPQYNN